MRRLSPVGLGVGGAGVLLAFALTGCEAVRDAFSPRAEVAARANDQTLTVERLAELAANGKQMPLEPVAISRLTHVWVDFALLAQALAAGEDLRDSATMSAAMWPLVAQLKWERFHNRMRTSGATLNPKQLDSAYQAGDERLFQHILFQVRGATTPDVDAQKRRQAERLLPQARTAGARFGQLAARYSEDPGSKVQGGVLGVSSRGQFVQAFEDAAWALPPGGVSDVVKSPFGYHIIRRPPLAEVRDSFRTGVQERMMARVDSVYLDSLSIKRRITPVRSAPALVRAAAADLDAARSSSRVVVKYRGGAFRIRDLVRWLSALDPQVFQAMPQASDDQINQFLKALVQRQLQLAQADSAGVTLTPEDRQVVRAQHDSVIAILGMVLNITPEVLRDSVATPEARNTFAMARVEGYLERVVQGRARFFPLPPFLAETLRGRARWSVDPSGVRRALERAKELRAPADSAARAPGAAAPRMTPAPGPAPIDTTR